MVARFTTWLWQARTGVSRLARRYPSHMILTSYAGVIACSTGLLMLPAAHRAGEDTEFVDALFTATSAVAVTGLATVDTGTHWSLVGQAIILVSIQLGGFGVLTLAALLGLLVTKRLNLASKILASKETQTTRFGDLKRIVVVVISVSLVVEFLIASLLFPRFLALGHSAKQAAWHAVFYAVSAFNNAGFSPTSAGMTAHADDWLILTPIMVAIIVGGLGFPVLMNVRRYGFQARRWSLHTKLTLTVTGVLLAAGFLWFLAAEWANPGTLGPMRWQDKVLSAMFLSVNPRTAGFNSIDIGAMHESSWLMTDVLMFIGGGAASTAGGIKATTLAVVLLAIVAEARGDRDVESFRRRIPTDILRLAVAVTALSATLIIAASMAILEISGLRLDVVLFEVISAYATTGLSTGITAALPDSAHLILVVLMFAGRVGTMTFAAALTLRTRTRARRLPADRVLVG